jgi:hypothetical protein
MRQSIGEPSRDSHPLGLTRCISEDQSTHFLLPPSDRSDKGKYQLEISRISRSAVLRAIKAVLDMGTDQKLKLADAWK